MLDDATGEGPGEGVGEGTGFEGSSSKPSKSTPTRRKSLAKRAPEGADEAAAVEKDGVDVAASELQRVRIETDLLNRKSKRPRSNSVPDSEEEGDITPPEPQSASRQLEEEATRHLASQSSGSSLPSNAAAFSGDQKGSDNRKHVVFGDDDDVGQYVAAAKAKTAVSADHNRKVDEEVDDDNDDDDDEAPEAVSTKAAAKETLKSAKAVADAAEK